MLYDEVKKLLTKSKLPVKFKNEFSQKVRVNIKEITQTERDTITALNSSINNATVILIEDNRRIFEAIENIKIDQFKELKFPFENFFIEFNFPDPEGNNNKSNNNMTIGLHVYPDHVVGLKSNNIYNVFMYNKKGNSNSLVPLMAMLKLNKLPRFYVACNQKCEQIINPTNLGNLINKEVCQRTERTAEHCHIAKFLLYGIKIIIYVINLINSQPKILHEDYGYSSNNRTITGTIDTFQDTKIVNNSKTKKVDNKYIYIQVEKLKSRRKIRINRITEGNRKSPRAHTRRGHYRHLKSGKVIWIEMSYVGLKEKAEIKNRKIYKIK